MIKIFFKNPGKITQTTTGNEQHKHIGTREQTSPNVIRLVKTYLYEQQSICEENFGFDQKSPHSQCK